MGSAVSPPRRGGPTPPDRRGGGGGGEGTGHMRGFLAQRQGGRPCDLSSLHGGGSGGGSGRGWSCGGGALGSPVLSAVAP